MTMTEDSQPSSLPLCPAVQRLSQLLEQEPTELDIAILSDGENDDYPNTALVLQDESFLGVNALDVPRLARDVRRDYWQCRRSSNQNLTVATQCLLLLCPDHATAWADRRRYLLRCQDTASLQKEISFLNLLMTKHTKA